MQDRGKVINRLALVLLSIVVLELVLIGDQVQPVKAIKKKIFIKKLKKILPLLALMKPKKKLILVPIPIPMFNKPPHNNYGPHQHMVGSPQAMTADGSSQPMSFMMMEPNLVGSVGPPQQMPMSAGPPGLDVSHTEPPMSMMMPSMTMTIQSDGGATMSAIELTPGQGMAMAPSSSSSNSTVSGALIAGRPGKWLEQQQYDYFGDEQAHLLQEQHRQRPYGGEHYYSSPWPSSRAPLASPAKLLRNERLKSQQQQQQTSTTTRRPIDYQTSSRQRQQRTPAQSVPRPQQQHSEAEQQTTMTMMPTSGRLKQPQQPAKQQFSAPMPVLIIKNQWRPSAPILQQQQQQSVSSSEMAKNGRQNERPRQQPQLTQQQEQQITHALEQESLVQVGPPQMLPIYQSANGRFSMTPPPPPTLAGAQPAATTAASSLVGGQPDSGSSFDQDSQSGPGTSEPSQSDSSVEVQTIGNMIDNNNNNSNSGASTSNLFQPAATTSSSSSNMAAANHQNSSAELEQESTSRPSEPFTSTVANGRLVAPKGKLLSMAPPAESKPRKPTAISGGY